MKLRRVLVQNYRCIVYSEKVDIEEGVTVIIGKNEQGKTNFLRALASFNQDKKYLPNDLPNHLRPSLEEKNPHEIPIVTLWLSLESEDKAKLKEIIEKGNTISQLKCTRFYGNNYRYWAVSDDGSEKDLKIKPVDISGEISRIKETGAGIKSKLDAHCERLPQFAVNKEQISQITDALTNADYSDISQIKDILKTFTTALKSLPSQDSAIQQDISSVIKQVEGYQTDILTLSLADRMNVLTESLPTFIFHTPKMDIIPNEVNIEQFVADPEGTSRGMLNLRRAAGLSIQKIKQLAATADISHREAYEDYYKSQISGGVNEFWKQEQYLVYFRFDPDRLSVSISDGTYLPRIKPSDRSEGFQWYLSFYSSLLNEIGPTKKVILLLDNPALELHVDGQRDIKRFLEEKMTFDSQIIYVTHSPAMIDPFNLAQLRKVVLFGNQEGTKIEASLSKGGDELDLLEPVRSAIGMSLGTSLVANDFNVLVEGAADKPIVEAAFAVCSPEECHKVLVNGSLSESKEGLLARFYARTKLPFVILLDADSGGRELEKKFKQWDIPEAKIISLRTIFTEKPEEFAIEDMLSEEFYHMAFENAYPGLKMERPELGAKKRTTVYETLFEEKYGVGFNKKRVAEAAKKLLMDKKGDTPTIENLKKIITKLLDHLHAQTKAG